MLKNCLTYPVLLFFYYTEWRWPSTDERYRKILEMFLDKKSSYYSIHQIGIYYLTLNLCMLGDFSCFYCCLLTVFKNNLKKRSAALGQIKKKCVSGNGFEIFRKAGFPQALEIMENLENHKKKFHAWKNHGI